jgi:hypothetical protein
MDFKCLYTPSYPTPRRPQRPLKRHAYLHGCERALSINASINGTSIRNQPSHIRNPLRPSLSRVSINRVINVRVVGKFGYHASVDHPSAWSRVGGLGLLS